MDQNHLNNFGKPSCKDDAWQVLSNSSHWFQRRCHLKKLLTDRRTDVLMRGYLWGSVFDLSLIFFLPTSRFLQPTSIKITPQIPFLHTEAHKYIMYLSLTPNKTPEVPLHACRQTDGRTDVRTDRCNAICHPLCGGIKIVTIKRVF